MELQHLFDYKTPLHFACESGKLEIVKLLIEHKADLTLKTENSYGYTAIHFAASSGNVELVKLLIAKGAEINEKTAKGVLFY